MNQVTRTIFALFIAVTACSLPAAAQQNGMDVNRMNRDIKIMENIIEEMFRIQSPKSNAVHFAGSVDFFRIRGGVRGTHLPGYGVIFTIPSSNGLHLMGLGNSDGNRSYSYSFAYGTDENSGTEINEESVINRLQEFLRDYGSTIGQLEDDDKVMVIYGANQSNRDVVFYNLQAGSNTDRPKAIPTISVVATKGNLDAYRSGRISESEFNDRLSVAKTDESDKQQLDMKVMSNIFETAFKENEEKGYRIRGSVNHLKLDNFGALFFFDASYFSGTGIFSFGPGFGPNIEVWSDEESQQSVKIAQEIRKQAEKEQKEREKKEEERREEIRTAYSSFKTQLKEFIVDYGRTLSSVHPDQYIMVSVNLTGSSEETPDRLDLQIRKSVLAAMERGNTSREQAMEQVVVREY